MGKEVELQADEDRFFRAFHCLQITTEIGQGLQLNNFRHIGIGFIFFFQFAVERVDTEEA